MNLHRYTAAKTLGPKPTRTTNALLQLACAACIGSSRIKVQVGRRAHVHDCPSSIEVSTLELHRTQDVNQ
ncbi:hypothetical protein ACHAXT_010587 [Thalassiosira profunda]